MVTYNNPGHRPRETIIEADRGSGTVRSGRRSEVGSSAGRSSCPTRRGVGAAMEHDKLRIEIDGAEVPELYDDLVSSRSSSTTS